jgi:hypothetical protein
MEQSSDESISIWQWIWLLVLVSLPFVGLVALVYYAFIGENQSRKNYCRAVMIMLILLTAASVIIVVSIDPQTRTEFIRLMKEQYRELRGKVPL